MGSINSCSVLYPILFLLGRLLSYWTENLFYLQPLSDILNSSNYFYSYYCCFSREKTLLKVFAIWQCVEIGFIWHAKRSLYIWQSYNSQRHCNLQCCYQIWHQMWASYQSRKILGTLFFQIICIPERFCSDRYNRSSFAKV